MEIYAILYSRGRGGLLLNESKVGTIVYNKNVTPEKKTVIKNAGPRICYYTDIRRLPRSVHPAPLDSTRLCEFQGFYKHTLHVL